MPAPSPRLGKTATGRLTALGARLRAHRKALKIAATTAAEAAGMSRVTLHRIESGEPSVTMGAYMSALAAIGLDLELVDASDRQKPGDAKEVSAALPRRIRVAAYPQLRRIAWQLKDTITLTPKAAFALYERNWRHVDEAGMDEDERDLVRRLSAAFGGQLLV